MSENLQTAFDKLVAYSDKVYDFAEAQEITEGYVLNTPRLRPDDGRRFATVFANLAPRGDADFFNSLNIMLGRQGFYLPAEPSVFDKDKHLPQRVNIPLFKEVIESLSKCRYSDCVSDDFVDKFQSYILQTVRSFDLTGKDIEKLSGYFQDNPCRNRKMAKLYEKMPEKICEVQNNKVNYEISQLNNWAFGYKNDDLLKKLSLRSTCINLLYKRLVDEQSIGYINPQDFYQQHRLEMSRRVRDLTGTLDKEGKIICRKYAINKVYKAEAASDNFKIDTLFSILGKYADQPFHDDCLSVLKAIGGGDKSRNVRMPLNERLCR